MSLIVKSMLLSAALVGGSIHNNLVAEEPVVPTTTGAAANVETHVTDDVKVKKEKKDKQEKTAKADKKDKKDKKKKDFIVPKPPKVKTVAWIDFSKAWSMENLTISAAERIEFDPEGDGCCKLNTFDPATEAYSSLTLYVEMKKKSETTYVLALKQSTSAEEAVNANITIMVNGQIVVQSFHPYNGADFLDKDGVLTHFRLDQFNITNHLKNGINEVSIHLDRDTQSGISLSAVQIIGKSE